MIYLIKTVFHDVEKDCALPLLKIGYAKNIKNRLEAYKTCNPLVEKLNEREGDYELESYLHKYFSKFLYPSCSEWFYYDQSIVDNFDKINISDDKEYILGKWKKEIINKFSSIPELMRRVINDKDIQKEVEKKRLSSDTVEKLKWTIRGYLGKIRQDLFTTIYSIVVEDIDKESLFENNSIILYETLRNREELKENSFEKLQKERRKSTITLLNDYNNMSVSGKKDIIEIYKSDIEVNKYRNNFIGISSDGTLEYNELIEIIYEKAWKISQEDFQNSIKLLLNRN